VTGRIAHLASVHLVDSFDVPSRYRIAVGLFGKDWPLRGVGAEPPASLVLDDTLELVGMTLLSGSDSARGLAVAR
jgi:hypothetical protein